MRKMISTILVVLLILSTCACSNESSTHSDAVTAADLNMVMLEECDLEMLDYASCFGLPDDIE